MSFFSYPPQIELTYLGDKSYNLALDWEAIKCHKIKHGNTNCIATLTAHEAISQLHRQLGYINNSFYDSSSTSTAENDIKKPFDKYGYSVSQYIDYDN